MNTTLYHHASCVSLDGKGILLLGESGAGKSDLALRLIHAGAVLVSDDQVILTRQEESIIAASSEKLEGLIEARGIGILKLPVLENSPLSLAIQLVSREAVQRLPEPSFFDCFGLQVPLLSLYAFDASICAKIFLYLVSQKQ